LDLSALMSHSTGPGHTWYKLIGLPVLNGTTNVSLSL
jgi:hypothetical protein